MILLKCHGGGVIYKEKKVLAKPTVLAEGHICSDIRLCGESYRMLPHDQKYSLCTHHHTSVNILIM